MTETLDRDSTSTAADAEASFPPSPAGPILDGDAPVNLPPGLPLSRVRQTFRLGMRPLSFAAYARRTAGEVYRVNFLIHDADVIVSSHPDHVRSLFTAKPELAPSITGESPLRPILGPNSVLTLIGEPHMRQRKLLLPPFHGDAVRRYTEMISEVIDREIDRWPIGEPFAIAPRMAKVTLDVIMAGVFGIDADIQRGTPEHRFRETIRRLSGFSTNPLFPLVELFQAGKKEATGVLKAALAVVDRELYAIIETRRAVPESQRGSDILSLLLSARDEDGEPMTDMELRDELLTLILAGYETTANSLSWGFERLLRNPAAYDTLRDAARGEDTPGEYVEATIHETMRVRPVISMVGRIIQVPWRLGDYVVPAGSPVGLSIILLHHREDVYPRPFEYRPERFLGKKPGTYTWIPFGGGIRRCLGATLAMAEQRAVLHAIARRTDMVAPDPRPEYARQRNVTTIPQHGGRVKVVARY